MICASPRKTCSDAPGYIFENLIHKTPSRQLRHYKTMTSSWISITFLYLTAFKECEICCNVFIEISYFDTNLVKFGALIISRLEEFDPPKKSVIWIWSWYGMSTHVVVRYLLLPFRHNNSSKNITYHLISLCSSFYSKASQSLWWTAGFLV